MSYVFFLTWGKRAEPAVRERDIVTRGQSNTKSAPLLVTIVLDST